VIRDQLVSPTNRIAAVEDDLLIGVNATTTIVRPGLRLWVNSAFGPPTSSKIYTLARGNAGFVISKEKTITPAADVVLPKYFTVDAFEDGDQASPSFYLTFTSSTIGTTDTEFETTIKQILSTFTFTNPTAGWKTYENKTFDWTVKYPKTWGLMDYTNEDETPDVELIFNKGASGLQKFFTDSRSDTLEEWKQKLLGGLTGVTTTVTEITVGGVKAIRIDTNVLDNLTYVGFRKGDVFVNVTSANAVLITSDILSTFTFTK
jgi:hypothetical protein